MFEFIIATVLICATVWWFYRWTKKHIEQRAERDRKFWQSMIDEWSSPDHPVNVEAWRRAKLHGYERLMSVPRPHTNQETTRVNTSSDTTNAAIIGALMGASMSDSSSSSSGSDCSYSSSSDSSSSSSSSSSGDCGGSW